jgi:hypothetical protein
MALPSELSWLVKQRCDEIGLTSRQLAAISGMRLEVVEQLLARKGDAISISDAESIANAVGLGVGVLGHRRRPSRTGGALAIASRTASTSFRELLPPELLVQALTTGAAASEYVPHIRALLDEAPLGLLADVAYELHDRGGAPPSQTWQTMRQMALSLGCLRAVWH